MATMLEYLTFALPEMGEHTWSEWLYPSMIGAADGKPSVDGRTRASKQVRM